MFFSEVSPQFSNYNVPIEVRWDGDTVSASNNSKKKDFVKWDKYFVQLQGLLSFFPHINLKGDRVIKLHLAAFLRHSKTNKDLKSLKKAFATTYNFSWGYVANDNLSKKCAFFDSDSRLYLPFEKSEYLNYQFFKRILSSEDKNYNKAQFYRKSSVNFAWSCFKKNQWNTIRIWWMPSRSADLNYQTEVSAVEIRFWFTDSLTYTQNLNFKQPWTLQIPYLYQIRTDYLNQISIEPILSEKIEFTSKVKLTYLNSYPLNSLWTMEVNPFFMNFQNKEKFYQILTIFPYAHLQNDLDLMRRWSKFKFKETHTTINSEFFPALKILGFLQKENFSRESHAFSPWDNRRIYKGENYLYLKYKKNLYRQFFLQGTQWNILSNKLEIVPQSNQVFLGDWFTPFQNVKIHNLLRVHSIWNYEFSLIQNTKLQNHFFQTLSINSEEISAPNDDFQLSIDKSIKIDESSQIDVPITSEDSSLKLILPIETYVWLVPYSVLRKIVFSSEQNILLNKEWKKEVTILKK